MNLYINRLAWARAREIALSVQVIDAEGVVVGRITSEVADWLVRNGTAMDITEREG